METKKNTKPSQTPILDMYHRFCKNGIPGDNGLCQCFEHDYADIWSLIKPNSQELTRHKSEGYCDAWWGDSDGANWRNQGVMTPLRQNIVLLLACLNDEL